MIVQYFKRKDLGNGSRLPFIIPTTLQPSEDVIFIPKEYQSHSKLGEVSLINELFASKDVLRMSLPPILEYWAKFKEKVKISIKINGSNFLSTTQAADFRDTFSSIEVNGETKASMITKYSDPSFYNRVIFTADGSLYFMSNLDSTTRTDLQGNPLPQIPKLVDEWDPTPYYYNTATNQESTDLSSIL